MKHKDEEYATLELARRAEWRCWLEENHAGAPGAALVLYRKAAAKATLTYEEAVEEALCFGWIDSRMNKLDELRFRQIFTPRKPGSVWAQSNKQRVARLIAQGLMHPAGMAKIEAAMADGSWNALDAVEALQVPADLQAALEAQAGARAGFEALGGSARKMILFWVQSARRSESRQARIQKVVEAAAAGRNPLAAP